MPATKISTIRAVGRIIAEAGAPDFKHVSLEMGGKNIIIVMDDANLDLAIDGAIWGGFGTTGQRCTAASRVAVHKSIYREFAENFVARVKKLKVGDGLDAATDMGPLVNEQQLNDVLAAMKPRLHLFGHHHEFTDSVRQGVRSIGLDVVTKSYLLIDAETFKTERLDT